MNGAPCNGRNAVTDTDVLREPVTLMPKRTPFQRYRPMVPQRYLVLVLLAILAVTTGCSMFSRRQTVKVSLPDFDRGRLINTAVFFPYENASQRAGGLDLGLVERGRRPGARASLSGRRDIGLTARS